MKLNFGKRLVLFLHWLLSLFTCALLVMHCIWPSVVQNLTAQINGLLGAGKAKIVGIVVLAAYIVFSIASVILIFSGKGGKKGERGFIVVDSNEGGKIRIAIGAVEQMIRQAVRSVNGIGDMKASISNDADAVSIRTTVTVINGAHVPTVTMNIQRAIRSYIELNCGIAVRDVSVSVQALENGEGTRGKKKGFTDVPSASVASVVPVTAKEEPVAEVPAKEEADPEPVAVHIKATAEETQEQAEPAAETAEEQE